MGLRIISTVEGVGGSWYSRIEIWGIKSTPARTVDY